MYVCLFGFIYFFVYFSLMHHYVYLITGPLTHSVGGQTSRPNGRWCLSSSVVCNAAHMQRNSPEAARGGPVVLRPVMATPCYLCLFQFVYVCVYFLQCSYAHSHVSSNYLHVFPHAVTFYALSV